MDKNDKSSSIVTWLAAHTGSTAANFYGKCGRGPRGAVVSEQCVNTLPNFTAEVPTSDAFQTCVFPVLNENQRAYTLFFVKVNSNRCFHRFHGRGAHKSAARHDWFVVLISTITQFCSTAVRLNETSFTLLHISVEFWHGHWRQYNTVRKNVTLVLLYLFIQLQDRDQSGMYFPQIFTCPCFYLLPYSISASFILTL